MFQQQRCGCSVTLQSFWSCLETCCQKNSKLRTHEKNEKWCNWLNNNGRKQGQWIKNKPTKCSRGKWRCQTCTTRNVFNESPQGEMEKDMEHGALQRRSGTDLTCRDHLHNNNSLFLCVSPFLCSPQHCTLPPHCRSLCYLNCTQHTTFIPHNLLFSVLIKESKSQFF